MKKILLFAGSNSPKSINRKLVEYASGLLKPYETTIIDLRDYPLPIFSVEIEENGGIPENALKLKKQLGTYDAFIISVAEHNGSITAFLKNALDWVSRTQKDYRIFHNKPVLLISTSPSPGGGISAVSHAESILKRLSGRVIGRFSISSYYENVKFNDKGLQIKNPIIRNKFKEMIAKLENYLHTAHNGYCKASLIG